MFSTGKLSGVDTYLGPEMKSTGEVMGVDATFPAALHKAMIASGIDVPASGDLLASIADRDKAEAAPIIADFADLGFGLLATDGTADLHRDPPGAARATGGQDAQRKSERRGLHPRRPGGAWSVNTLTGRREAIQDGHYMRRAAAETRTPMPDLAGHGAGTGGRLASRRAAPSRCEQSTNTAHARA